VGTLNQLAACGLLCGAFNQTHCWQNEVVGEWWEVLTLGRYSQVSGLPHPVCRSSAACTFSALRVQALGVCHTPGWISQVPQFSRQRLMLALLTSACDCALEICETQNARFSGALQGCHSTVNAFPRNSIGP